ncbi:retrovirus-related pol polyprotein from transposon TNT 1-94 [Tanacetum coccineum]
MISSVIEQMSKQMINQKAQRIKPTLYDGSVISSQHDVIPVINEEETLILEEVSRSKMLAKQNDPILKEKKINTTPINYVELNQLSEDFGKRFVPQQELSAEQAFWLQTSNPNTEQYDISLVRIEAPSELPKVSLVNTSLKKLKIHISKVDTVVKKQITPDAITEGEWRYKLKILPFELKEHIKFMRENEKEEKVLQDIDEIETINIELKHKNTDLKAQIQDKVFMITSLKNDLQKLKGKEIVENAAQIPIATTISLGMFKLGIKPISHRLKNNKDAHEDYLKKTIENTDTIRRLVERTCPSLTKPSEKLVAVIPMNKIKKVRFSEHLKSSSNIYKKVESSKTPDSNTPMFPSTGLKSSTSACRSQPTGNKKNDKISQTPSSNMKNKVEAQLRRVNLNSNKKNHVKDPICDANVKHTMLNDPETNLYTISLDDMLKTSLIYLPLKASKTMSWLWHRRLSHLNFGTLNKLAKYGLARGILKLKFKKDHLCSACALGKSKKSSHQPKAGDINQEKLYLLHMDLCGSMRVKSINRKKYILVIVDDYSRFTWVKFIRSKDEAPDAIIK